MTVTPPPHSSKDADITFTVTSQDTDDDGGNTVTGTAELTQKAHKALANAGVDACFYWFTNNWHYINGWEHLRNLKSLGKLSAEVRSQMQDLNNTDFSKSDAIMGRTISSLIKIGWTPKQVKERAEAMKSAILSTL